MDEKTLVGEIRFRMNKVRDGFYLSLKMLYELCGVMLVMKLMEQLVFGIYQLFHLL